MMKPKTELTLRKLPRRIGMAFVVVAVLFFFFVVPIVKLIIYWDIFWAGRLLVEVDDPFADFAFLAPFSLYILFCAALFGIGILYSKISDWNTTRIEELEKKLKHGRNND